MFWKLPAHPSQSVLHKDITSVQPTATDEQQSSDITQLIDDHSSLPDKLPKLNWPISTSSYIGIKR